MSQYLHSTITGSIIATAKRVYAQLGSGQRETPCVAALATALRNDQFEVSTQVRAPVKDENGRIVTVQITDLVINDRVAIEVKAIGEINDSHKAQLRAWLRSNGVVAVGLVINFGPTLEYARVFESTNYDALHP